MTSLARHAVSRIEFALDGMRVAAVLGPRQAGKSTLVAEIARRRGMTLVSLDDEGARQQADLDPTGFIAALGRPAAIDEIQRSPNLLLAVKVAVDRDNTRGAFLLTGSASLLTAPRIADSLAGRMATVALHSLSQAEIERAPAHNLVDRLFAGDPPIVSATTIGRDAFADRVVVGGYPEVVLGSETTRRDWHESYLDTVMNRDLRELDDVRKVDEVPRLLRAIAARAGSTTAWASISRDLGIDRRTAANYGQLLETLYLTHRLPAWRASLGSREVAAPKLHVIDSGLLCNLLNADRNRLASNPGLAGQVFESFCVGEFIRHLGWSTVRARTYHYREENGNVEVDLLMESTQGQLVGVEMKSSATVRTSDFKSLAWFRDRRGDDFVAGVVIYTGTRSIKFGDRLWALPVSALWSGGGA